MTKRPMAGMLGGRLTKTRMVPRRTSYAKTRHQEPMKRRRRAASMTRPRGRIMPMVVAGTSPSPGTASV